MGGLFKRTLAFLGFTEPGEENFEDDDSSGEVKSKYYNNYNNNNVRPLRERKRKVSLLRSERKEIKTRVFIAEPHDFNGMKVIGDNFKNNIPVIINLQKTNTELSKRIVDFCSGLTYALGGSIKKVAERVFLITPHNVEVTSEDEELLREKGLFNHFQGD